VADAKSTLVEYLQSARGALVWKVEGLSEYDARRPLTPTGSNLLGLVKHLASVELGYFGDTFGRPSGIELPWHAEGADPNADLYLAADESREWVLGLYRTAQEHAAQTFAELGLDAVGHVPWWPSGEDVVTLHQVLVHMVAETQRHAGHADILRESVDGAAGRRPEDANLDRGYDWPAHVDRVEAAARAAARTWDPT
jgi:uncharacterized damage-inducible protein DinB